MQPRTRYTRDHWPTHMYPFVSRDETDKEVNVKARLPAWAKGKSVILDMTQTNIKLSLKEEADTPIIEVQYRVYCNYL